MFNKLRERQWLPEWGWLQTARRMHDRFNELHGGYLASTITLTSFISLFPLLVVGTAIIGFVSHNNTSFATDVVERLGLTGQAADAVLSAISTAQQNRVAATIVGVLGLLWAGLGFAASMSFTFDSAWQVKGKGWRDKGRYAAWLLAVIAFFSVSGTLSGYVASSVILAPFVLVVSMALGFGWWLCTFRYLTHNAVGWKAFVPGAVFGAIALELLKLVGRYYVPRLVEDSSAVYGSIGVVFAILAWLFILGRVVVYSAVLNVIRWEEDHGTVTVELKVPDLPNAVPLTGTRAGEADD